MTGQHEPTGPDPAMSSVVHWVTECQTAGTMARLRLFAPLQAQGVLAAEADDLVAAAESRCGRRGAERGGRAGRDGAGFSGRAVRGRLGRRRCGGE